jgi:hypothetical protein
MNATKLTLPVLIVVGFAAGILVGYLIQVRGPKCVDQPPQAAIVVGYNSYVPPSLQAFYKAVAVGADTNAVFRRDMVLVDVNGCSVPPEFANAGGTWCPGDPCRIQPNMGQQVTQRVGYRNSSALKQALDLISSTPTAP